MKNSILGILLFAVALTHAQVDSAQAPENAQNNSPLVETVTEEAPADTSIAEEVSAEPERTPEGYRIIRISVEDTKQYKDSVTKAEKARVEAHYPLPLSSRPTCLCRRKGTMRQRQICLL